jgi:CCR4-NOT transcription complex subunit 6
LRALESFANRSRETLPLVLAGDLNSGPDSSVYELISTQAINPRHPDLAPRVGQFGAVNVLPDARQISHRLPLGSAYATVAGAEPEFTNYTMGFRGTLDYIWFDQTMLRCAAVATIPTVDALTRAGDALPNPQYPSDHTMLIADFLFLS